MVDLALCSAPSRAGIGGDGGIRTLDRALQPYNGLANRRLQPLGHISPAREHICPRGRSKASGPRRRLQKPWAGFSAGGCGQSDSARDGSTTKQAIERVLAIVFRTTI